MITPAAVGTWAWIEQSTPHQICHELSRNSQLINSLAEEILITKKQISYPVYSKLFCLLYSNQLPLDPCLKIIQALQSNGFYELPDCSEFRVIAQMNEQIAAHDLDQAIAYFKQIKKGFGYEEICTDAFQNALQHHFEQFIPRALETLTNEKRHHILNKCLRWSAEMRDNDKIIYWLNQGASVNSIFCMDGQSAAALNTTEPIKHLFHIAVLTNNPELALVLISKKFDINLLGNNFNPLDHFIEKMEWGVVKAYVNTYGAVNTPQTALTEKSVIALTRYCLNIYQLISDEKTSIAILVAMLNSGFDINYKLSFETNYYPESLLEFVCRTANGYAFVALIKALNGIRSLRMDVPICNDRLANFFTGCGTMLEEYVFCLLALSETRQTIYNILLILSETYSIDKLLEILLNRDLLIDSLLKNAFNSGNFSDDFLIKILTYCEKNNFRSSLTAMIPLLIKTIKRRLSANETVPLLKLTQKGMHAIFYALIQKELPHKLSKENNLLDLAFSQPAFGGAITMLINQGFMVDNLETKLLSLAIREQDLLLLDRAVKLGVDLEKTLINGLDPLAYAIYNNKPYGAQLLLEAGRSPDKPLHRPFPDGSDSEVLKPLELAILFKRFKIAARIIKHSDEIRKNVLDYQQLFEDLLVNGYDEEKKELLNILFEDFPFAAVAVLEGPLNQCIPNLLNRFKCLSPAELRTIESKGRSVLEIPWLLGKLNTLGVSMLRCLSTYQSIFTLDHFDRRLGEKSAAAFQILLGIDRFHYQTIEVVPVLEPTTKTEWDIAVSHLMGICAECSDQYLGILIDFLASEGKLENDLENYPQPAAAVFLKHFDGPYLVNEIANLMNMMKKKEDKLKIISFLFENNTLPSLLHIHRSVFSALFLVFDPLFKSLIDTEETFRDEDIIYTGEHLFMGFVRILVNTQNRDAFIGTPKEKTPEIEDFYAVIRKGLIQLMRSLVNCEDKDAQKFCLAELGMAGNRCGGRWIGCLHQQLNFLKGKNAQFVSFLDEIYLAFRDRRQAILDELVLRGQDDVHVHNQIYKLISKHLNLPGADLYENIVDNFAHPDLTENRLLGLFYKKYHPLYLTEILNQFLLQVYKKPEKRELLVLWIKSNIPEEFDAHFYQPITDSVKKAISEKKSRQEIAPLMNEIYWSPDQPDPLKCIQDHRFLEFMDQIAMDENGRFKFPFLLYILFTISVLSKPRDQ